MVVDFSVIDAKLDELDRCTDSSTYDKLFEKNLKEMRISAEDVSALRHRMAEKDPFSPEYMQEMKNIHTTILRYGKRDQYSFADEGLSRLDMEREAYFGLPFETQNADYVGEFLQAYGFVIQNMNLGGGRQFLSRDAVWAA